MSGVFQRVIVPVEFQPAEPDEIESDRAVEVGDQDWVAVGEWTVRALELAARLAAGGELYIVHATRDVAEYATWTSAARTNELEDDASRSAVTVLSTIAEQHCPGVTLHYVIKPGNPLDVILQTSGELTPDAIVLAASSRSRLHRAFLGSTTDKVIRQSTCPVVVVPSGAG